jgi:hypothetical protein
MQNSDTIIATLPDHAAAEEAVKKLAQAGFDMKSLTVIGQGFHTEEKVVGFYNTGDRIKFWGGRGAGARPRAVCNTRGKQSQYSALAVPHP